MKIKPLICGVSGPVIDDKEKEFLRSINPTGFVVFKKNLKDKEQAKLLTQSLKELFNHRVIPILIDQEGGAVLRLKKEHWRQPASPLELGKFAYLTSEQAIDNTRRLVYLNGLLIGYEMHEIGINVNCAPVADLLIRDAHHITSTRSFGPDPFITAQLVKAMAQGLLDAGVTPIIKHMIGQGRANCDSHLHLPIVEESLEILENSDFKVFSETKEIPWGMPAHIIYNALDPHNITTYSRVTMDYIRNKLGFKGVLISDCLTMSALQDAWKDKAIKALSAGLDLIFYGSCKPEVINEINDNINYLADELWQKIENSLKYPHKKKIDFALVEEEFEQLFAELDAELKNATLSPELEFILEIIAARKAPCADFTSPLYNV